MAHDAGSRGVSRRLSAHASLLPRQVYSGRLKALSFNVELQGRGEGIVNTMAYLYPRTQYIKKGPNASEIYAQSRQEGAQTEPWPRTTPWTFYNTDGSIAPVLHQFDRDKWLFTSHDQAAEEYIKVKFPEYALRTQQEQEEEQAKRSATRRPG